MQVNIALLGGGMFVRVGGFIRINMVLWSLFRKQLQIILVCLTSLGRYALCVLHSSGA